MDSTCSPECRRNQLQKMNEWAAYKWSLYSTRRMKFPWLSTIYDSSFGQDHSSHSNSICAARIMWWLPGQLRTVCWNINTECAQERARMHACTPECVLTLAWPVHSFSCALFIFHLLAEYLLTCLAWAFVKGSLVIRTFFAYHDFLSSELLALVVIHSWQMRSVGCHGGVSQESWSVLLPTLSYRKFVPDLFWRKKWT